MDAGTQLQLLLGAVRPFILGKVRDAIAVRLTSAIAKRRVPTPVVPRTVHSVFPLPSSAWIRQHGDSVVHFAESSALGNINAYGIARWNVGDADPIVPDIRSVHELSRMHPWCAMALAATVQPQRSEYWIQKTLDSIVSFLDAYPPPAGVHWLFPMGIAIRATNMSIAMGWLREAGANIQPALEHRIAASLVDHATLVRARQERSGGMTTSHHLANLVGMLAVGSAIPGDPRMMGLFRYALRSLHNEIQRHILPDGFGNEASTGYHRQVVDLLLVAAHIIHRREGALPEHWVHLLSLAVRAQRALDYVGMPLIGDNDDGMAVKLTGFHPDTSFLHDMAARLPLGIVDAPNAHAAFPNAGLDIYQHGAFQVVLRAGPIGQYGKGGHAHNDQTSIVLRVKGVSIIIDPGSSTYTGSPQQRNVERSVRSHCVVRVDSQEQNLWPADENEGLFWMTSNRAKGTVILRNSGEWIAETRVPAVRRQVLLERDSIAISDSVASGNSLLEICVPLDPSIQAEICDGDVCLSTALDGLLCRATFLAKNAEGVQCPLTVEVVNISCAPRFGELKPSTGLIICAHANRIEWAVTVCN